MTRNLTRRKFLGIAAASAAGLALYSGEFARHELDITRLTIALPNLPEAFRGFTIAQISDIHYHEFSEAFFVRHVVHTVNSLKPDLVALTGDFITASPLTKHQAHKHIVPCAELLAQINSPLRYAVLGNHDALINPDAMTAALVSHGIPVLANRYVPIEKDGQRIWLSGIEDACIQRPELSLAVPHPDFRQNQPVILLGHEPDFADIVVRHGVDLMLSGHTHGGQIRIPFMGPHFLPELGDKYVEGLFSIGPMQLYVNRGIGTVGLPARFRCPPEITLITLEKKTRA